MDERHSNNETFVWGKKIEAINHIVREMKMFGSYFKKN